LIDIQKHLSQLLVLPLCWTRKFHCMVLNIRYDTIRYDTIVEFNVDSKAEYTA